MDSTPPANLPLSASAARRHPVRLVFTFFLGLVGFVGLAAGAINAPFLISKAISPAPGADLAPQTGKIPDTGLPAPSLTPSIPLTSEPSRTPFLPVTNTSTPTRTHTPTQTPTPTLEPTTTSTPTKTPTATLPPPTPTPSDGLPDSAEISGVYGYAQSLPLSCESRSAVDWARYFDVEIGELDFQFGLPTSDNPNTGFVGSPRSTRGQIPPNPYGVHAAPVAALLRAYGLNAQSYSGLSFTDLRREIAAGEPVIVWVIGNVWDGYGQSYTASDGETVTVAANEHTVILIGYNMDTVMVVDGALGYSTTLERFLASWGILGNMAVIME